MTSPDLFDRAWQLLLGVELGYSNHPNDPGGPTNYGVTQVIARKHGYEGDMRLLPIGTARRIAKAEFWDPMRLDHIAVQSEKVAQELLEAGYHMGPRVAPRLLQRALNAFGDGSLGIDGLVGEKTLQAMMVFLRRRGAEGEAVLLRVLNSLQCVEYLQRVELDSSKRAFIYGWIAKRVKV